MKSEVPKSYVPAPECLADKVVLVTGAAGGIGSAVAVCAARHGATVVLLGKTVRTLEAVYDEIVDASGPTPAIHPMDLGGSGPDDYDDLAREIGASFGRLDGLVHAAAAFDGLSPVELSDPIGWARVMHVNSTAPFLMTRACLGLMRATPHSSVVFTTDTVGRRAKAYWGAYAVSKFAIEGLCQTLADELDEARTPRVNCLNPGPARTALRRSAYPAEPPDATPAPETKAVGFLYLLDSDVCTAHGLSFDFEGG